MLDCATFQFHACCRSQAEKSDNNLVKSKGQIIVKLTEGKGNHIKSLLPNNVCGRKAEADVKKACVERVNGCCQHARWGTGQGYW